MLLHRRDGNVPTADDVYKRAWRAPVAPAPHPITHASRRADPRSDLAAVIFTETTTALLVAGWLTPIDHRETSPSGKQPAPTSGAEHSPLTFSRAMETQPRQPRIPAVLGGI
jgi:hypothetical protein